MLLFTADEELGCVGAKKLLEAGKGKTRRAIIGEPTSLRPIRANKGYCLAEIDVQGKEGHSAYPGKADNPIPKLSRLIDRLSRAPIDTGTANFEASNCQVTVMSVPNTAANVIPAEARATFTIRYNDLWRRPSIEEWVRLQCDATADAVNARYDVTFSGTGDVFLTQPGPLVDTLVKAIEDITGRTPALTTGGGTSDARFVKDHCPVVEFGLVNEMIHKVDERVAVADLESLTRIYGDFIARYFTAKGLSSEKAGMATSNI